MQARLFGPIEVTDGGRSLGPRDPGSPKAKQVLELLLVATATSCRKTAWPISRGGPKRAFAASGNHVSVRRRHLDIVERGRELVITVPDGYQLAAERIDLAERQQ